MVINVMWPMTDEPMVPERQWLDAKLRSCALPCGHDTLSQSDDPIVVSDPGDDSALTFVDRIVIEAIRTDLHELLRPELDEFCHFRLLVDIKRQIISRFVAVIPKHSVWLRGGKKSMCRRCEGCGRLIYNPMGNRYVLKANLPEVPIFATHQGGIAISDRLLARVNKQRWRKVKLLQIPVYDEPRDIYPEILENVT
jgi:hypothetical protein